MSQTQGKVLVWYVVRVVVSQFLRAERVHTQRTKKQNPFVLLLLLSSFSV
jgi:hypothetical protein